MSDTPVILSEVDPDGAVDITPRIGAEEAPGDGATWVRWTEEEKARTHPAAFGCEVWTRAADHGA